MVERTFAWLSQNRRLSKDYEPLCAMSEAWISLAVIRLRYIEIVRLNDGTEGVCAGHVKVSAT